MMLLDLLPRGPRRTLIDSVYGSEEDRGLKYYLAAVWGLGLLAALIVIGFTPWAWPAQREARVESLSPVLCEDIRPIDDSRSADDPPSNSSSRSKTKARGAAVTGPTACRQSLTQGDRTLLGRAEQTVSYLQRGGATPPPLGVPEGTPLRDWIDGNICGLGGAGFGERGALAWHVWQGIGECSGRARLVAQLPLAILLGPILGMLLTPLLLGAGLFYLGRHTMRLPATRRAYRRLYGSEHKAP